MVTIDAHPTYEVNVFDTGAGGLPPVDDRPTGGGGNGDDWGQEWQGPWEQAHMARFFVFCALFADLFFFSMLAIVCHNRSLTTPASAQASYWLPPLFFLNGVVLLLGGAAMEIARRRIFREADVLEEWLGLGRPALASALPWLKTALVLGGLFVVGQLLAWRQLAASGLQFPIGQSNGSSYDLFQLSGVHLLQMLLCLGAVAFGVLRMGGFRKAERRQLLVDAAAWSWHAMTLAWIGVLATLACS